MSEPKEEEWKVCPKCGEWTIYADRFWHTAGYCVQKPVRVPPPEGAPPA